MNETTLQHLEQANHELWQINGSSLSPELEDRVAEITMELEDVITEVRSPGDAD